MFTAKDSTEVKPPSNMKSLDIEARLFDLCRWNDFDRAKNLLESNHTIDIFYKNGKFFDLAISNKSSVMLKALLDYCERNKPADQGDERLKFECALKNILEKSSTQYHLSEDIKQLISPYLEGSSENTDEADLDEDLERTDFDKVAEVSPEKAGEVLQILKPLLNDAKYTVRESAFDALGKVVEASPEKAGEVLEILKPLLNDAKSKYTVRESAFDALDKVAEASPEKAEEVLDLLKPLLKDTNSYIRESAFDALGKVLEASPEKAEEVLDLLKPLLNDAKYSVRKSAFDALGKVLEASPEKAGDLLKLLKPLLNDADGYVRKSICDALGKVVEASPEKAEEVLQILEPLLNDVDWGVRKSAFDALGKVVEASPEKAGDVLQILKPLLNDADWRVCESAFDALGEVLKASPEKAGEVLQMLKPLLNDAKYSVRKSAFDAIGKVLEASPEKAGDLLKLLKPLLNDADGYVRKSICDALGKVVEASPEKAGEVLKLLKPLHDDNLHVQMHVEKFVIKVQKIISNNLQSKIELKFEDKIYLVNEDFERKMFTAKDSTEVKPPNNMKSVDIEARLFDLCRWNDFDRAKNLLESNHTIDIFYKNGKFFDLAISNKSSVMLKALLDYCERNKPADQGDERLKFECALKNILEKSSTQHHLSEDIKQLILPYLEGSSENTDEANSDFFQHSEQYLNLESLEPSNVYIIGESLKPPPEV